MRNLFTPHTPVDVIIGITIAIVLVLPFLGNAQTNSIKSDSVLNSSQLYKLNLIQEYEKAWFTYCNNLYQSKDWELTETKNKWWYYLPSVGFTLGMPSVSFGTGTIAQIDKDNRNKRLKRLQLHEESKLNYNEGLQRIKTMYARINQKVHKLDAELKLFALQTELFKISKKGFQKGDLTPSEVLEAEISFEQSRTKILLLADEVMTLILDLEEFSRYQMPNRQFLEGSDECILESQEFQKSQETRH